MDKPIRVQAAPGLIWRTRDNNVWEARWQCRTDIIAKGYHIKSVKVGRWSTKLTIEDWDFISETCKTLQMHMLDWARGDEKKPVKFDKRTLGSLMECYQTDPDSRYKKLRHASRVHYDTLIRLIKQDYGKELLSEINVRTILRWHERWSKDGKVSAGHAKIGMLRILFGFGFALLENADCQRVSQALGEMTFQSPDAREEALTAEQAIALRAMAHERGRPSIALAQAIQFELMLRQKDVIGEWVPLNEPVMSDVIVGSEKWIRGLRWEEIDTRLTVNHRTSKKNKKLVASLRFAPMVLEELEHVKVQFGGTLPTIGPVIRSEFDGHPWSAPEFRRWWRQLADACGIPKSVKNMDSRSGAISEAEEADADVDDIRESATHSNVSMTRRYMRGRKEKKIARVQMKRLEGRNKTKNSDD